MQNTVLPIDFFRQDVLEVAPALVGKTLVRDFGEGKIKRYAITETEAYRGEIDLACHASKGRTPRTEVMYHSGGVVYVYLIYGMYWMLNFVTGPENSPQALLIRGIEGIRGPGKTGKELKIDRSFYGEPLNHENRIWIEDSGLSPVIQSAPRIGIDYAGEEWSQKPWRFFHSL